MNIRNWLWAVSRQEADGRLRLDIIKIINNN